jgi:hypothetical protein
LGYNLRISPLLSACHFVFIASDVIYCLRKYVYSIWKK